MKPIWIVIAILVVLALIPILIPTPKFQEHVVYIDGKKVERQVYGCYVAKTGYACYSNQDPRKSTLILFHGTMIEVYRKEE